MVENRYKVKSLKRYNVQSSGNQPQQAKRFQTFEDLEVYQVAREFRKAMYAVSRRLPDFERFELASQIRRAAVSLTNNIAEGHGRFHYPDQIKLLLQARGSLEELIDDLNVCLDENYLPAVTVGTTGRQPRKSPIVPIFLHWRLLPAPIVALVSRFFRVLFNGFVVLAGILAMVKAARS